MKSQDTFFSSELRINILGLFQVQNFLICLYVSYLKRRDKLEYLGINRRIILKWAF
jgi:hypothetical protein